MNVKEDESLTSNQIIIPKGKKHVSKTKFEGSAYFNVIVMYFLSHKHDDCCAVLPQNYETDSEKKIHWFEDENKDEHEHEESCVLLPKKLTNIPSEQTDVSLRWIQKKKQKSKKILTSSDLYEEENHGYISVPKNFFSTFSKCPSKRFIVFPFGYTCLDSGHANYMLYDSKLKSLERFETFGKINSVCINPPNLDKKILELFVEKFGSDFIKNYYTPLSYLPNENFQTIQEKEDEWENRNEDEEPVGYCSVWSAWYIDLRLSNPDIDREKLVNMALTKLKKLPITFTSFIRNYSSMLVDVSNEIQKIYKKNERHKTNSNKKSKTNNGARHSRKKQKRS
jgi:hypothetical protein